MRARSTCCAAAPPSSCRFRAKRSTSAPPDRTRVAIDADAPARERIQRTLGDGVDITSRDVADVVLFDAPGVREALAAIAAGFTEPTILLVDDPHTDLTFAALRAGAVAVLARQSDVHELLAALGAVRAGLVVLDASARDALGTPARTSANAVRIETLTDREREVLSMLANGWSNHRIAARLAISDNTVKAHVASILAKLGATTRTEAVTLGIRLGLVML
jgi:NarL family two-component system response regulator YdfI